MHEYEAGYQAKDRYAASLSDDQNDNCESMMLPVIRKNTALRRMRKKSAIKKHRGAGLLDLMLDIVRPRKVKSRKYIKRLTLANASENQEQQELKHLACMCSVVALHALLAKVRGNISAKGFLEFRCLFPIGDMESRNLRYLFKLAWEDTQAVDHHILHITALYPEHKQMYQRVIEGLARQMLASGAPTRQEIQWLHEAAAGLALSRLSVRQILERAEKPLEASPYWLFNLPKNASKDHIQKAYKKMMLKCHPDKVHGARYPETGAAAEKLSTAATVAYADLKRRKHKIFRLSA